MIKVRPIIWFVVTATVAVLTTTAYNHNRGKINVRAFQWLAEQLELTDSDNQRSTPTELGYGEALKSQEVQKLNNLDTELSSVDQEFEENLKSQEKQKLNNLDMQLRDIEQYVPQERQRIENWYLNNLAILNKWANEWLEHLEGEQKAAWARFCENLNNTISNKTGGLTVDSYGYADSYFTGGGYATTNSYIMTDGYFSEKTHTFVVGNPAGQFETELNRIKNSRRAIEYEFVKLQQKRENSLAEVERYAENQRAAIYVKKQNIKKGTEIKLSGGPGMVQAISTSNNGQPFIMLEGKIYYEGSIINGWRLNKIKSGVEFTKNGKIWIPKQ
jgi:hypothetical protein